MRKVDVALSIYGKPYQTALTLASLLRYSGDHVDAIYFHEELAQPYGDTVASVAACFSDRNIIHYKSKYFLGCNGTDRSRLHDAEYRESLRYQYAWENTDKDFLFISHNDCVFTSDTVGGMLQRLEDQVYAGVGWIGQCWNCPARTARVCNRDIHESYKPTYQEVVNLIDKYPSPRTSVDKIDVDSPMPLPECRLNEFGCLINVGMLRQLVTPEGDIEPFGAMFEDIGTVWFRKLVLRGYRFLNWYDGMVHSPFSKTGTGHAADSEEEAYVHSERKARAYLAEHFAEVFDKMEELHRSERKERYGLPQDPDNDCDRTGLNGGGQKEIPGFTRVRAIHPDWSGYLLVSKTSDLVEHEGQNSKGTYRLEGQTLTVFWEKYAAEIFLETAGSYNYVRKSAALQAAGAVSGEEGSTVGSNEEIPPLDDPRGSAVIEHTGFNPSTKPKEAGASIGMISRFFGWR